MNHEIVQSASDYLKIWDGSYETSNKEALRYSPDFLLRFVAEFYEHQKQKDRSNPENTTDRAELIKSLAYVTKELKGYDISRIALNKLTNLVEIL